MENLKKYFENGEKLFKSGKYAEAKEEWENGIQYIKQNKTIKDQKSSFLVSIGNVYFDSKDFKNALKNYKSAITSSKSESEKLYITLRIGECYYENGNEKKALEEFETLYIYEGKKAFENEDKKYFEIFNEKILKNPNKKTELREDFRDIFYFRDFETLKRVFDIYKIDAKYNGVNAFVYPMNVEKMKFFIERGLDPNADCGHTYPAIAYQSHSKENIEFLKKYNVDLKLAMEYNKDYNNLGSICNLMDCGVELGEYYFCTIYWLEHCSNIDIISVYRLSKLEIEKGLKITQRMQDAVVKIGERFEFYRDSFNKDEVDEYSEALDGLYKLFDVSPVARKEKNSLNKKITVKSTTWQEQHTELWKMLVPGSGKAESVQGEMIRIIGKVLHELLDNGAINWNMEYRKMLNTIPEYISRGVDTNNKDIIALVKKVNRNSDVDVLYPLNELIVKWVLANPNQIALGKVEYTL